jgi:hypothetical protein
MAKWVMASNIKFLLLLLIPGIASISLDQQSAGVVEDPAVCTRHLSGSSGDVSLIQLKRTFNAGKVPEAQLVQQPALGRGMSLGSLYDMRAEMPVTGFLWSPEAMQRNTRTIAANSTSIKYASSDSREAKRNLLDVSAELSLSYALVEVSGSASFLQDKAQSSHEARVSMAYTIGTVSEELDVWSHDLSDNLRIGAIESKLATHVVTKVEWGSSCIATFARSVTESTDKMDVQGALKVGMMTGGVGISGEADVKFRTAQNISNDGLSVTIKGDVVPQNVPLPRNISAAKAYMEKLPTYVGKGVPVKITLFPLKEINTTAAEITGRVEAAEIARATDVLDELDVAMESIGDLLLLDPDGFLAWKWDVENLRNALQDHTDQFTKNVSSQMSARRNGGTSDLRGLASDHYKTEFSSVNISNRVVELNDEIQTLKALVKALKKANVTIAHSFSDYSKMVVDTTLDSTSALILKGMRPFTDPSSIELIRNFATYAQNRANKADMGFVFIHYDSFKDKFDSDSSDDNNKASVQRFANKTSVQLFRKGRLTFSDFTPPGVPTEPTNPSVGGTDRLARVTSNVMGGEGNSSWVKLSWGRPTYPQELSCDGCEVLRYQVKAEYWERDGGSWQPKEEDTITTLDDSTQNVTVYGLTGGRSYRFRVAAINPEGAGPWSDASDPIAVMYSHVDLAVDGQEEEDAWAWNRWGPKDREVNRHNNQLKARLTIYPPIQGQIGKVLFGNAPCDLTDTIHAQSKVVCLIPEQPLSSFTKELQKYVDVTVYDDHSSVVAKGRWLYKLVHGTKDTDGTCTGNDGLNYVRESDQVCNMAVASLTAVASNQTWAWNRWGPLRHSEDNKLRVAVSINPPETDPIEKVFIGNEVCSELSRSKGKVVCSVPPQPDSIFRGDSMTQDLDVRVQDEDGRVIAAGKWQYRRVMPKDRMTGGCLATDGSTYPVAAADKQCNASLPHFAEAFRKKSMFPGAHCDDTCLCFRLFAATCQDFEHTITVKSAGWNASGGKGSDPLRSFIVDGQNVTKPRGGHVSRGITIIALEKDASVKKSQVFDTHASRSPSTALAAFLGQLETGTPVLMAAKDEAGQSLTEDAIAAIKTCGAKKIGKLGYRGAYALIGIKGGAALAEEVLPKGSGVAVATAVYNAEKQ